MITILEKTIITNKDWFNLCIFGDWHLGNGAVQENRIDTVIDYIKQKNKDEYGIILVGDLIENVVPGSKGSPFELSEPDPEKQKELAANKIKKFKNLLLCSVEGNHELRTRKRTGGFANKNIIEKVFGDKTDEYYAGICSILKIKFKNKHGKYLETYTIYITHGAGNGSSVSGKITKLLSLRDKAIADIYVQGHIHSKLTVCDYIRQDNTIRKRIFASCSSYIFDAEYAQEAGFNPTDYGINNISINTKKHNVIGYI